MINTFSLIETILWENGDYYLLPLHIKRLKTSAEYFNYNYDEQYTGKMLDEIRTEFKSDNSYKIRLLLAKDGSLGLTYNVLNQLPLEPLKIIFSEKKTDKNDIFYYHKTTNRALYNAELESYRNKGYFDVIFENQDSEVTEGAITNIFIQKDDNYFTPPVSCGILNGVFRKHLLNEKKLYIKEKVLHKEDLFSADKIYLTNSVRKMIRVILSSPGDEINP